MSLAPAGPPLDFGPVSEVRGRLLTLTPTLSQKERAIWILLLPVPFGAVG